jgi:hypothetical protein
MTGALLDFAVAAGGAMSAGVLLFIARQVWQTGVTVARLDTRVEHIERRLDAPRGSAE